MNNSTTGQIYCDYSATAPLRPEVQTVMDAAGRLVGNPSSIHRAGQAARVALERARQSIAGLIGARSREIVFTSGGTEANNSVILGALEPGDHVVTSQIEHPSVHRPLERMAGFGIDVTQVAPAPTGEIPLSAVEAALRPNTRLISVMAVNNETGVGNNIAALGELAAAHSILLHTDAVQALGKAPLNVKDLGVHFLSAAAHKIGGPRGVGLLYVREGTPYRSLISGGEQENNHRGGTENVMGAAGFAKALELAVAEQDLLADRLTEFRERFLASLTQNGVDFRVNGSGGLPAVINLQFPGMGGQPMVVNLDGEGVASSYGSSCASGTTEASHVLLAMGLSAEAASESIRISFGFGTTAEEVDAVAAAIVRIATRTGHLAAPATA